MAKKLKKKVVEVPVVEIETVVDSIPGAEAASSAPALQALGKGQKYFETPDGRILVGPKDSGSIPDPENPNSEVNPMRLPTPILHGGK